MLHGQVFDPSLVPALVEVLRRTFMGTAGDGRDNERFALIALTRRNEGTIDAFVTQVRGKSTWFFISLTEHIYRSIPVYYRDLDRL